jgi:hypothetical protein
VDTGTGRTVGAQSLVLPLEPGTDYKVYDTADKSGYDYTNKGRVKFSLAVTGSGIEVHMTNTALGTLYVHDFQIRGVAYIAYDQVNLAIDDVSSQDDYGRRVMSVSIPLQVSGGDALAEQIARYLLGYYAVPQTRIGTVGFEGPETVNGVSLYAIDIGDVVELSETQTAISGMRHWVIGLNYALVAQDLSSITLVLAPLGEHTYLVLDDPVYGLLDQNRLAL